MSLHNHTFQLFQNPNSCVPGSRFSIPGSTPTIFWNTLSHRHTKKKKKKIEKKRTDRGEKMLTLLIMIIPAALKSRNALLIYGMYL